MHSCAACHTPIRPGTPCPTCRGTSRARSTAASLLLGLSVACVGGDDAKPPAHTGSEDSPTVQPAYGISTTWTTQDDGYTTDETDADTDVDADTDTDGHTGTGSGHTGSTSSGGSGDGPHSGGRP
jgi:hypothetical protein